MRLLILLAYPGTAVAVGVAPRLARGAGEAPNGESLARSLQGLIVFQAVLIAPLAVWAIPIVRILLGSGYSGSVPTVRVLSICAFLAGMAPLVSLSVNYLGDARRRVPLMISAAALDGLIDVVLIPRIGIVSGAIATAAGYAVMVGGHIAICRRHLVLPLRPLALTTARALLAAAAMAGVLLAFGTDPSIPLVVLGGAVSLGAFLLALVVTREVKAAEAANVSRVLFGRISSRG